MEMAIPCVLDPQQLGNLLVVKAYNELLKRRKPMNKNDLLMCIFNFSH